MATATIPNPVHARNMRLIGYSDQGGRADGNQIMVHRGYAYIGHMYSQGFSVIDVRDPSNPPPVELHRRAARTPGTSISRLTTTSCWWSTRRDMKALPAFADDTSYYKGKSTDFAAKSTEAKRTWTAGMSVWDISQARRATPDRVHAGRGRRAAPDMVCRRSLGLCVGADRRLQRLHPDHDRCGRPDQAARGGPLLAAGHESRGRRDATLAAGIRPIRPASPDRPWRYRLLQLARRLPRRGRCRRP